jgi:outer membrane murein-binding lipoprotein Lpp
MSHPGYDDSKHSAPEEPAAPTSPGAPDHLSTQPVYAAPTSPSPYSPAPVPEATPAPLPTYSPTETVPTYQPPAAEPMPTYQPPVAEPVPTYVPSTAPTGQPQAGQPQFGQPQFGQAQFGQVPTAPPGYPPTANYPAVPAPPTYDPAVMAQQYSAPPTSGPYGYGMPMMSGIPAPLGEKPRGRAGTIVLSVLTAVFLVAAGILGTLFIIKNKDADKLTTQVSQLTTDANAAKAKSEALQKDLDTAKRDLSDAKDQLDQVTAQKKAITDCFDAIKALSAELARSNGVATAAAKTLENDLNVKCSAADKYMAPTGPTF